MDFSNQQIKEEAEFLYKNLHHCGWTKSDCKIYAPLTLDIKTLKKEKEAIILAHSYQTPDIMYGVADFIGDSYGLSKIVAEHPAQTIVFCGVYFMAETAKLLNPYKKILTPKRASCSLAESITATDVRKLKKLYPDVPIVCYVNTTAEVKAEADICCTSANVVKIIESINNDEIIFIPDEYMGKNLQELSSKKIITWPGRCIVHEVFDLEMLQEIRAKYPDVKILAHTECRPSVINKIDYAGGTTGMLKYIKENPSDIYMLVTECGLSDRVKIDYPQKKIVGSCSLCPYMKETALKDILQILKNPQPDQIVEIPKEIAIKAKKSLDKMFEIN